MPGFSTRVDMATEAVTNGKLDYVDLLLTSSLSGSVTDWTQVTSPAFLEADITAVPGGTAYTSNQTSRLAGATWLADRSTDKKFLAQFGGLNIGVSAAASPPGTWMVMDRLVACKTISLTAVTSVTISSPAVPRYSGTAADGNEVWVYITTSPTVTAPVINLSSYTTADGTTAQVGGSLTIPVGTSAGRWMQLPLTAALRGARSVETLAVTTAATAGVVTLAIVRPLARLAQGGGVLVQGQAWNECNYFDDVPLFPQIFDGATLQFLYFAQSATTFGMRGTMTVVYG